MKVTALSVWKWRGQNTDPICLGKAEDVEEFGYFQRASVREMLTFISKTIVARTQPGQRQSVEQDQYLVHVINRNGLAAIAVMDKEYPSRSAFCVLQKICDDYCDTFGQEQWKTRTEDDIKGNEIMEDAIVKYQDPMAADKILKIQRELDDTKVVLYVRTRGCYFECNACISASATKPRRRDVNSSSYIFNSRREDAWTEYDLKSVDKSRERLRLHLHFFLVRRRQRRRQRRRARRGEDELEKHHPIIQNIIDEKERERENT